MEMKVISILNIKGGVAKTISAANIADRLASDHGYRVLLVDNDKQGNSSKMFGAHSEEADSIADVLTRRDYDIRAAIRPTGIDGLSVLPADMSLIDAEKEILMDSKWRQQTRLYNALKQVSDQYDYVIIDNAPDLGMAAYNALVASDELLIPIKLDQYALDGISYILDAVRDMEENRENRDCLRIAGAFITLWQPNRISAMSEEHLREHLGVQMGIPIFDTKIRSTVKVVESTYADGGPLRLYSPKCTAALDYAALVREYLQGEQREPNARNNA